MTKQSFVFLAGIFACMGNSAVCMADPPDVAHPAATASPSGAAATSVLPTTVAPDAATVKAQTAVLNAQPSILEGLQIQSGLSLRMRQPVGTIGYYNVTYKDQMITQHGKSFQNLDATHQFTFDKATETKPNASPTDATDTPRFLLDLTSGKGDLTGSLFNALGVNSFLAPRLDLGPFRMAGRLSGRFDGREINYALSVETPTIKPLRYAGIPRSANIANWLVVGFGGEQQYQHNIPNAVNQITAQLTYRSFIGKATRWRPSKTRSVPFTLDDLNKAYHEKTNLIHEAFVITERGKNAPRTAVDDFIVQMASELGLITGNGPPPTGGDDTSTPAGYTSYLQKAYTGFSNGYLTEPTYGVWVENTGQYKFTGDAQGDRFKYALALVLSYWRDFGSKARSQFQLRYESGYDYGNQQERYDRVLMSVGLNF
jgi:hypothetical protein